MAKAEEKPSKVSGDKQKRTPKKRTMLKALEKTLGVVTTASEKCGVSRSQHYKWLSEDEVYAKDVADLENLTIDFGESKLHDLMNDNNAPAVIFFLKTKGKKRGYTEGLDITSDGDKIGGAPVMITMAEARQKLEELENNI